MPRSSRYRYDQYSFGLRTTLGSVHYTSNLDSYHKVILFILTSISDLSLRLLGN